MLIRASALTEKVIGSAIEVHRTLGPGLLESAYDRCLVRELILREIDFKRQVALPIVYKGERIDCGYRVDFIVDDSLLLEIKSVERVLPIHQAQIMTYLKLLNLRQGLLINFNSKRLVDGLRSVLL